MVSDPRYLLSHVKKRTLQVEAEEAAFLGSDSVLYPLFACGYVCVVECPIPNLLMVQLALSEDFDGLRVEIFSLHQVVNLVK